MASHVSKAGVPVTALQFDASAPPVFMEADGSAGEGWKVKTDVGYVWPKNGDWIVVAPGQSLVIDGVVFALLFEPAPPAAAPVPIVASVAEAAPATDTPQ